MIVILQAKNTAEMRKWVSVIQNGIANALSTQCMDHKSEGKNETNNIKPIAAAAPSSGKEILGKLRNDHVENRACADCGANGL